MAPADAVRQQLPTALLKLAALQRRVSRMSGPQQLLPEVLGELEKALHELEATCDDLREQADQLALARADAERIVTRYRRFFEAAPDACLLTDDASSVSATRRRGNCST